MSQFIVPGDDFQLDLTKETALGPGMYYDPKTQRVAVVAAGMLNVVETKRGQTVYVDYNTKRYIPAVGDFVIGTITGAYGDRYKVSLSNFSNSVSLSYMAFPNASKKNRPTLKVGDLAYARICSAEKELEAEIECMDSSTGVDSGFGSLENGMVIETKLPFARRLLFDNDFPLLQLLAKHTKFEIAIGLNGVVWVKCAEVKNTLACYRSILDCQNAKIEQYKNIIKMHFEQLSNAIEE
ncbi:hypothetical protein TPHA_0P01550 [Tetrapisispora phaffii CBS 4417]|uniref:Ribosomal RNA-processing protein 40 n=1 Tax=Tetrapisispora phaffii (strain ATCC 24235 / CBS 4417 / NBRC 1672 / NRRL Y-8282 / UCD 70-5) TaxID=1071381 RepID=G8C2D5_TETPH|nr:exosome complex component RRP40 TPHA_0P01550 [Tetrapisispora phaffii CBS 4417]CCE66313.1 hypothetical protein TPHA_0P01550 [Tetrapisispora phaffii CBS 4417]